MEITSRRRRSRRSTRRVVATYAILLVLSLAIASLWTTDSYLEESVETLMLLQSIQPHIFTGQAPVFGTRAASEVLLPASKSMDDPSRGTKDPEKARISRPLPTKFIHQASAKSEQQQLSLPVNPNFPLTVTRLPESHQNCSSSMSNDGSLVHPGCSPLLLGETIKEPIRVRVLLFMGKTEIIFRDEPHPFMSDELWNICTDGFNRSQYFDYQGSIQVNGTETVKEDDDMVWVVDMRRMLQGAAYTIPEQLLDLVKNEFGYQKVKMGTSRSTPPPRPRLKVVLFDYRDRLVHPCQRAVELIRLSKLLGPQNLRIVLQQRVTGRSWNAKANFPQGGELITQFPCLRQNVLHAPYTVRSDYALAVESTFPVLLPPSQNKESSTPPHTMRPTDVVHYWTVKPNEPSGNLRNAVSELIRGMNDTQLSDGKFLRTIGSDVSTAGSTGRSTAQVDYLDGLLSSKVVVVAQRDQWEDHYRLFEAIIGGALVMTDPMLTLPQGYQDGLNIVVYKSIPDLEKKIRFYLENPSARLEIARRGWEEARYRHMPEHWMERLFFGRHAGVVGP